MTADRRVPALLLVGLTLIVAAACTAWFLANFERQTEQVPSPPAAAARRNPFLAAERFLARLGIPVESRAGRDLLLQPPPTTDTLVVNGLGPLNAQRRAALRAWLAGGGRLVVEATELWEQDTRADDLLGDFGIQLKEVDQETKDDPSPAPADGSCPVSAADAPSATPGLAEVVWGDGRAPLTVSFHPGWYLEVQDAHDAFVVRADGRTRLVQKAVGAGWLTVTSDHWFLTNDRIGRYDHALLLAQLARPAPGGKVWLLYDAAVPWLGALLWGAAPAAVVGAALLMLAWVWSLGARLGPRAGAPDRRRRDLIEHLDAAAAFVWRHERAAHLVAATRRQVQSAWQRRRPELRHLGPVEQAAAIARLRGESAGPRGSRRGSHRGSRPGRPPDARAVQRVTDALLTQAVDAPGFIDQARILQSLLPTADHQQPVPAASSSSQSKEQR